MISKTQGPKLKVIDTPGVAEVHADNIVSVIATQAGVVITLGATRAFPAFIEDSSEPFIAVNARIALTPPAVAALHQRLGNILAAFTRTSTQGRRREQTAQNIN